MMKLKGSVDGKYGANTQPLQHRRRRILQAAHGPRAAAVGREEEEAAAILDDEGVSRSCSWVFIFHFLIN